MINFVLFSFWPIAVQPANIPSRWVSSSTDYRFAPTARANNMLSNKALPIGPEGTCASDPAQPKRPRWRVRRPGSTADTGPSNRVRPEFPTRR